MNKRLTFSTVIASQIEWTLAEEFSSKIDASSRWRAGILLAVDDVFLASFSCTRIINNIMLRNVLKIIFCNFDYSIM